MALAFVALLMAGCGSGGGSATGESKSAEAPLDARELIAKADSICVAARRAFTAVTHKYYPHPEGSSVPEPTEKLPNVGYAESLVPIAKRIVGQLEALDPPPQLRSEYEAYVNAMKEVEKLEEDALKASIEDAGDDYYRARLTRDAGTFERHNFAKEIGLKRCSALPWARPQPY